MPVTDFRQRTAVLFIAVVLGHIILISAQVNSSAGVPLVQFKQERARAERARQLENLLGFKEQLRVDTIAAGVIGASASLDFRGITIDRGTSQAVAATPAGVC